MGFIDGITAEDRVQVKFSDFQNLVRGTVKAELMVNAIKCEVPYNHIIEMITGKSNLLSDYEATKLSPDLIEECKKTLDEYKGTGYSPEEIKILSERLKEIEAKEKVVCQETEIPDDATQPENEETAADSGIDSSSEYVEGGDTNIEVPEKPKRQIDIGKIMALKNAGWKIKDIADEMRMEPQAVSNAIWRYKKSSEGKDNGEL